MTTTKSSEAHTPKVQEKTELAKAIALGLEYDNDPNVTAEKLQEFLKATLALYFEDENSYLYQKQFGAGLYLINNLCNLLKGTS